MNEYPLITKRAVRKNRSLKSIQKEYHKSHRGIKGHYPKARISKVVRLRDRDNFFDFTDKIVERREPRKITAGQLQEILRTMNISGLGGSGFPAEKKLQAILKSDATNKILIINGVECDPGLLHDAWLIKNRLSELEAGIRLLAEAIPFQKIILATKDTVAATAKGYEIAVVPDRYPMGAEKILAEYMLCISLAPKDIPAEKGILIMNVQTLYAIYEAVYLNRPEASRLVTVADLATGEAVIARVNLGTPVTELIDKILRKHSNQPVYAGGGILSARKAEPGEKLNVKTNFIAYGKAEEYDRTAKCRNCGACARKCPMKIKVNKIVQQHEKHNGNVREFHPELCLTCGSCTYHCAAGKNVMEIVSAAKEGVK
jgi:Na+-translocating ferredoxin:NAD+ oxidoreductase RnfC subunit